MMKKVLLISLIGFLPFSLLFSVEFDWGGAFQNSTSVSSIGESSLTQVDSLSLWGEINVNPMVNFKGSFGYKFYYNGTVDHIPEFGALYAYGSNESLAYKAGRFTLKDMNNNLFNTIIDGGEFGFRNETFKLNSGIGFTGFVFNDNSSVFMTSVDYNNADADVPFAPPRLAEYVEAAFYILPGDGSVTVALLAQQDLLASSEIDTGEGLLHTFYLNAGLKGRLWDLVFYNLYGTGEVGVYSMTSDDRSLTLGAGALGLKVDIPLPLPLSPLLSVDLYYSSGDNWDRTNHQGSSMDAGLETLHQFTPFSQQKKGYVYSVNAGNLIYGDIAVSISPLDFISIALESLTLFRAVDGPVSVLPVIDSGNSSLYLGEELTLTVNLRPLSDLGFQVIGGVFIPNDSVVSDGVQYKVGAFASLSF